MINVMIGYKEMLLDMALVSEMYAEEALEGAQSTGRSFSNPFGVIRSAFSEIIVFWTFYYLTLPKKKTIIVVLLFISLLVPPLNSFANASRTQMLYWIIHIIICVIIFYPFYSEQVKKYIKFSMVPIVLVVFSFFTILTVGRFASRGDSGTLDSIIAYGGQGTLNFANDVLRNDVYQMGDNTIPLFRQIIGLNSSANLYERQDKWRMKMDIIQGAFYTVYGDIIFDFSVYLSLIFLLIISFLIHKNINKGTSCIHLKRLFLLFFWCSLLYNGLFYDPYKTIGGNLKIITHILFYIMLKFKI